MENIKSCISCKEVKKLPFNRKECGQCIYQRKKDYFKEYYKNHQDHIRQNANLAYACYKGEDFNNKTISTRRGRPRKYIMPEINPNP